MQMIVSRIPACDVMVAVVEVVMMMVLVMVLVC